VSGRDFLHALVLGAEVECRIGNAVYPAHYESRLAHHRHDRASSAPQRRADGCSVSRAADAMGVRPRGDQPVGLREMFGTMTKSFHPGAGAQNGLTAAFWRRKLPSSRRRARRPDGWAHVLSTACDYAQITPQASAIATRSCSTPYKPFACGVVLHPIIDACLQLARRAPRSRPSDRSHRPRVHPLVLELTGKRDAADRLEGKFSVYFAAAVAIAAGAAGVKAVHRRVGAPAGRGRAARSRRRRRSIRRSARRRRGP
jgi:2-methylcitrate dehydratase PrpD